MIMNKKIMYFFDNHLFYFVSTTHASSNFNSSTELKVCNKKQKEKLQEILFKSDGDVSIRI